MDEVDIEPHHARHRILELARDIARVGLTLFGHALGRFLFGDLEFLDADELFLERLRRPRTVANLVAAPDKGNFDVLVAVREPQQNVADAADWLDDGEHAEHCDAGEHDDYEQAHAEIDPGGTITLRAGLHVTLCCLGNQSFGRLVDQRVHLGVESAGAADQIDDVAVILRGRRKFATQFDILPGQRVKLVQRRPIGERVA